MQTHAGGRPVKQELEAMYDQMLQARVLFPTPVGRDITNLILLQCIFSIRIELSLPHKVVMPIPAITSCQTSTVFAAM